MHPYQIVSLILLGSLGLTALAEEASDNQTVIETEGGKVYRQVGPDGEVLYSDKPMSEQAEPVQMPRSTTYKSKPVPRFEPYSNDERHKPSASPYQTVKVTYPQPDQVIWDNTGTMRVTVDVEPPLQDGDQLQLLFNGEVRYTGASTTVSLSEVWRNTYNIVPRVINSEGETVATGEGVTFHMKQHSRN